MRKLSLHFVPNLSGPICDAVTTDENHNARTLAAIIKRHQRSAQRVTKILSHAEESCCDN